MVLKAPTYIWKAFPPIETLPKTESLKQTKERQENSDLFGQYQTLRLIITSIFIFFPEKLNR